MPGTKRLSSQYRSPLCFISHQLTQPWEGHIQCFWDREGRNSSESTELENIPFYSPSSYNSSDIQENQRSQPQMGHRRAQDIRMSKGNSPMAWHREDISKRKVMGTHGKVSFQEPRCPSFLHTVLSWQSRIKGGGPEHKTGSVSFRANSWPHDTVEKSPSSKWGAPLL